MTRSVDGPRSVKAAEAHEGLMGRSLIDRHVETNATQHFVFLNGEVSMTEGEEKVGLDDPASDDFLLGGE
jgi:hypothetical protein